MESQPALQETVSGSMNLPTSVVEKLTGLILILSPARINRRTAGGPMVEIVDEGIPKLGSG